MQTRKPILILSVLVVFSSCSPFSVLRQGTACLRRSRLGAASTNLVAAHWRCIRDSLLAQVLAGRQPYPIQIPDARRAWGGSASLPHRAGPWPNAIQADHLPWGSQACRHSLPFPSVLGNDGQTT